MSTQATNTEYGKGNVDHVPHITPLRTYLLAWGALMVLTVVTVAVSYLDFAPFDLFVALAVAAAKAAVVALVFMHLWHDNKFNSVIFVSGLVFLAIFVSFTMFDTESRGVNEAGGLKRPADITNPFAGTKEDALMRAKWERTETTTAPAAAPVEAPAEQVAEPKAEPKPEEAPAAGAEGEEPKANEAEAPAEAPKEEAPAVPAEPAPAQ